MLPCLTRLGKAIAGLATVALVVTGCGDGTVTDSGSASGKIKVVASTNVWGSVAQAVGGDAVEVTSILSDPAADPHSYEGKPADTAAIGEAGLVLHNGGGYDDFFSTSLDASGTKAARIEAFQVSGKAGEPEANEHVWYDLPTVRKVADLVAQDLGAIAPDRKELFAGNAKAFGAGIDELITKVEDAGKAKPGAAVVATEPVADYLIDLAGLKNATPAEFAEAIEEESDPSIAAVAETTDLITGKQVVALINNAQTEIPATKQLTLTAAAAGVPVVPVTETLPEGVTGYLDWMSKQVDALAGALKG